MKIRFIAVTCFGLLGCLLPAARGFRTPEQPALPNYDVRAATKAAPPDATEDQAAASLKSRVPAAQIARDNLLGVPKLISASRGFLTGPNGKGKAVTPAQVDLFPANDPHRVIKAFVNEHSALFGHDAKTLSAATVTRDYVTEHNGMRTVVWQQTVDNIPVFEGVFMGHLTSKGELVSVASRFVPEPDKAAANGRALVANPTLSAARAVALAARNLGADLEESSVGSAAGLQGPDKHQSYSAALLRGEAQVELRWLPVNRDSMRLCWRVELTVRTRPELYSLLVDVETGEVLVRHCLTEYIKPATYNVYTSDSPSPFSPGSAAPSAFQPPIIPRQLVTLTALSTNASPNGWINDADNETRGNNVDAHADKNGDDTPDLPRPQGVGPARVFNYPLDLALPPGSYSDAAVVNLFYWNNFMHDKLYELGFTEAAGNFQNNNFGRGGRGSDAVQADAQDGSGFNNANFSSPADGSPGRMQMFLFNDPNPDRDGDLDAEVMCHEYGHGVSSRLVGGGAGLSALQSRGMGEGWSDFYGTALLSEANDDVNGNYAAGGYVTQDYYFGSRRYPYSTDMNKNPLTFKDIDPSKASSHPGIPVSFQGSASEVHNQGEVWCVTLWDARVALVEKWGFTVGNQLILRLVTDGMKLSPVNPNFLEARDAIIRADEVGNGGENYNELWIAFAKRGMGSSAKCPPSETTIGVSEAYDVPPDVAVSKPDGILEVTLNPPANSALFAGSTQAVFLRITDAGPVTNVTIDATINGTNLVFRNDGVAPDVTASNSIYSAAFIVPTNVASVTLTFNITAPGKDPATGAVNYVVIGIPANDNFTNAIKVPPNGAFYVSNNKLATLETNEPIHAGISTASASLWWNYAPTNNGPVLVDTAGSTFNSIVAVYTNATLATLGEVASADDFGTRDQAFVVFNGRAGITYRIAVASAVPSSTGTVYLNVAPNGMADTNPPIVTVTSPMSGLTVATNRVLVTGTAVDPEPVPSGINDVSIRVSSSGAIGTTHAVTDSLIVSSNWSRQVGLSEGLNIIQVSATDVAGNKSATVTVQVNYVPNDPANDLFANALSLTAVPEVSSVSTTRATKEFNEPAHAGNAGGKSVWWWFQAPDDGVLSLSTTNSDFDTLLAVYTGSAVSALTLLADNDDAAGPGGFSALTVAVRSNQTYRIAVDGFDGASGVVFLHYAFTPGTVYNLTINTTLGGHVTPSSGPAASNSTVVLTATPDEFFQFDNWTGSIFSRANPLSVIVQSNLDLTAHFSPILFTDDFETGNLLKLGWTTSGDAPWIVQTNTVLAGSFSAQSGAIGNSQSSSLRFTTNFAGGAGSFYFKVSSEPGWDFLQFYVDDSLVQQWSGEVGWQNYPFSLANGTHTLEWRYTKDSELAAGQDAAFLDNVNLPINPSMEASTPAYLQILRQTDGSLLLQIQGQTNREYVVQGAADLTPPVGWQDLATNVATGGVIQYVDPSTGTNPVRFYRAVAR